MRVLVCYDVDGWAEWYHADGLRKYAPAGYEVATCSHADMRPETARRHDVLYHCYLGSAHRPQRFTGRLATLLASHAWMHPKLDPDDWRTNGVTRDRCLKLAAGILGRQDAVVARSEELARFGRIYNRMTRCIPVGVDTALWYPDRAESPSVHRFRVGWCGQRGGKTSFKGFREIVEPIMALTGDEFEWDVNDRAAANALGPSEMRRWYNGLDVLLSTSSAEGTPNPPYQAAACGVPFVSTCVGGIADWTSARKLGLVVPAYHNEKTAVATIEHVVRALRALRDSPFFYGQVRGQLLAGARHQYSYDVVAPKLLRFIAGEP